MGLMFFHQLTNSTGMYKFELQILKMRNSTKTYVACFLKHESKIILDFFQEFQMDFFQVSN